MALATKCPHCNTIFRVAADQLKLRGGIVRCGSCSEVFDGNAALVEPATKPAHVVPLETGAPVAAPTAAPTAAPASGFATVDFEIDFDEVAASEAPAAPAVWRSGPAERPAAPAPAPASEPAPALDEPSPTVLPDGRIEPTLDTAQEHIVLAALDDAHHFEDLPPDEPASPDQADASAVTTPIDEEAVSFASFDAAASREESAVGDNAVAHQDDAVGADDTAHGGEAASGDDAASDDVGLAPHAADDAGDAGEPALRDDTALHAVAAVNTDVADDGESLPDDEAEAADTSADDTSAASRRERALQRAKARGESAAALGAAEEGEDLDHSDLNFVKRVERSQKYGKAMRIFMALGTPVLLAGLALQATTTFRDTLAASYPQLKPVLSAVCEPLGCQVGLPAQLDALGIEQGELQTLAPDTFSFTTVLRNQSRTVQAWPHVELTLNDDANKPVLRRVFAPREYLAAPSEADKGFGPRSEQSVKLYFELKQLKASGYHIAIFYP